MTELEQDLQTARAQQVSDLRDENMKLRYMLWLRHNPDHYSALYGDDDEMQCAVCFIDFRRMSVVDIKKVFVQEGVKKILAGGSPHHIAARELYKMLDMRMEHLSDCAELRMGNGLGPCDCGLDTAVVLLQKYVQYKAP